MVADSTLTQECPSRIETSRVAISSLESPEGILESPKGILAGKRCGTRANYLGLKTFASQRVSKEGSVGAIVGGEENPVNRRRSIFAITSRARRCDTYTPNNL